MSVREIFGERLEELIEEKASSESFSKELLCKTLGIEISLLYKYLRKEVLPFTARAIQFADYFKCSLDFLFGFAENYQETQFTKWEKFSERFRQLLKEKGIKRQDLKKTKLFAKQSIDDWFNDVRLPTIDNLIELREYFGCTLDYLVGRDL